MEATKLVHQTQEVTGMACAFFVAVVAFQATKLFKIESRQPADWIVIAVAAALAVAVGVMLYLRRREIDRRQEILLVYSGMHLNDALTAASDLTSLAPWIWVGLVFATVALCTVLKHHPSMLVRLAGIIFLMLLLHAADWLCAAGQMQWWMRLAMGLTLVAAVAYARIVSLIRYGFFTAAQAPGELLQGLKWMLGVATGGQVAAMAAELSVQTVLPFVILFVLYLTITSGQVGYQELALDGSLILLEALAFSASGFANALFVVVADLSPLSSGWLVVGYGAACLVAMALIVRALDR
jgi:hypothetical protein